MDYSDDELCQLKKDLNIINQKKQHIFTQAEEGKGLPTAEFFLCRIGSREKMRSACQHCKMACWRGKEIISESSKCIGLKTNHGHH